MKICDIHTHSSNSFDAENTVEEMCNSACNKGLFALAITDHCEAPEILLGSESEYGDFSKLIQNRIMKLRLCKIDTRAKSKY